MKTNNTAYSKGKPLATVESVEGKQDKLTAGDNITIENNVISAAGGGEVWDDVTDQLTFQNVTDDYIEYEIDTTLFGKKLRATYSCYSNGLSGWQLQGYIVSPIFEVSTGNADATGITIPINCVTNKAGYISLINLMDSMFVISLYFGEVISGNYTPQIVKLETLEV